MTHLSHGMGMSLILLVMMTTEDGCIYIKDNVEFSSFALVTRHQTFVFVDCETN